MIFLSHSWKNKSSARKVVEALAEERLPCWLDEQQIDEGAELRASLMTAISQSNIYLYLVSNEANDSAWVQDELRFAMSLEHERKIVIIPVRLADNAAPLPTFLSGRISATLDGTKGGAARLAHTLYGTEKASDIPDNCRLSSTVRLEQHRLAHTLQQTRELLTGGEIDVRVLLLDDQYEAIDGLYWNVAEVKLPPVNGTTQELETAAANIAFYHEQSRAIIKEVDAVCHRYLSTGIVNNEVHYRDAGHERIIRVLLTKLRWNANYLRCLRDGEQISEEFVNARHLPAPFDGHKCDFVSDGLRLGGISVPKHGHPFPEGTKEVKPWGLTSPFSDLFPQEVGIAVGEIVARRFLAQTIKTTELPAPESLTYGLS